MIISGSTDVLGIDAGLSISANAVEGSDTIEITGQTSNANNDITFTVKAPNGNLVSIDQISPRSNGYFATVISVGGPLWSQDGTYTITAQQGNKYMYIDSVNIRIADGVLGKQFGYGITSEQNKQYQNDCTATNIKWDKKIERGESFTITWNNPDANNCRYDVSFYHNDKTDGGVHYDIVRDLKGDWDSSGTKFFKICPTNDNDCKSPFYSFTLEDTSGNIVFIIVGIVVTIGISIAFVSKKNIRKKSPMSSSTPASTEKPQEENNTDIEKQIAINEEKIRKIEEESKRLDEED
jgi:uncharacterized protein (UPF0333 family)